MVLFAEKERLENGSLHITVTVDDYTFMKSATGARPIQPTVASVSYSNSTWVGLNSPAAKQSGCALWDAVRSRLLAAPVGAVRVEWPLQYSSFAGC